MSATTNEAKALQACVACRKQKRKCNKALPQCFLCVRMGRRCDYSDITPSPNADDFANLRQQVTSLEARLQSQNRNSGLGWNEPMRPINWDSASSDSDSRCGLDATIFPSAFFLDTEFFNEAQMSNPKPTFPVPRDVANTLGTSILDIQDVVDRYFANIHTWLPFVSKKRMEFALCNTGFELTADFALLLLAMKLIIQVPTGGPRGAISPLYSMTKKYYAAVEAAGIISLQSLQANLLIATYEIGHSIYPAAYVTTGHCARIGHALGLHNRRDAPQLIKRKSGAWAEIEEARRIWWVVMLLDRYVNLGSYQHPLATGDPAMNDLLPADDELWDEGQPTTSEPLYVSSASKVGAGAFARCCQATHLVGRLIRLLNDRPTDAALRFPEAIQLHRTIQALTNLLPDDVQRAPQKFGTALALCHGALLHLYDPFCCTEENRGEHTVEEMEMQTISLNGLKAVASDVLHFSRTMRASMEQNPAAISPLMADCLYTAAATFAWMVYETGTRDDAEAYHFLRKVLEIMSARWSVATQYLAILDKARVLLYPQASLLLEING